MATRQRKSSPDPDLERRRELVRKSLRESGQARANYSVSEFAELYGMSADQALRLIQAEEVESGQRRRTTGSPHFIPFEAVVAYGAEKLG